MVLYFKIRRKSHLTVLDVEIAVFFNEVKINL